ncbi:MAG: alpha/beta hydrolase [Gemmatimonadetes bacterium]|nr:alpha/beta hydrolase [Gemmatimonadota bacterium]
MRSPSRFVIRAMAAPAVLASAIAPVADAQTPRLFFEQDGEGPAVVFIEEWAHDTSSWFLLLPSLRESHRLVRYDLRGQGRSEAAADGDYSLAAHGRDLERVLDGLGLQRAHLVGVGLGARIALEVTLARPHRVRSLVLIQPRLEFSEPERAWWELFVGAWGRLDRPSLGEYSSVLVDHWVGTSFATAHRWVPPFYDLVLRRQAAGPLIESLRSWIAAPPVEGSVPPGIPALIVIGGDGAASEEAARRAVPTAARLLLPRSHWPILDASRELGRRLEAFLQSAEAREEGGAR